MPNTPETVCPRDLILYAGSGGEENSFSFNQLAIGERNGKQWRLDILHDSDDIAMTFIKENNRQYRGAIVNASSGKLESQALEQRLNLARAAVQRAIPGVIVIIGEDSQALPADIAKNPCVARFSAQNSVRRIKALLPERYRVLAVHGDAKILDNAKPEDLGVKPGQELVRAADTASALEIIESIDGEIQRILLELGAEYIDEGRRIIDVAHQREIPTIGLVTPAATGRNGELLISSNSPLSLMPKC